MSTHRYQSSDRPPYKQHRVVIAGGTGGLGRRLADDFASRGDHVSILTRSIRPEIGHRQVEWDGRTVGGWATELEGALLVNLAGQLVDCRPTRRNIELLRRSRVEPTRALVDASKRLSNPPTLWLQMSTLAIYGDSGQELVDESHPVADGPAQMAGVARPWEEAVGGAVADRLVIMRTGVVFDNDTAAHDRLSRLARFGLGGRIAAGTQWVSWIHIADFLRAVTFIREHGELDGVVHITSPEPVQNRDMMAALRRSVGRPWAPPTPTPLVHLGARLMGSDPALALTGRRCVPRRLIDAGYPFDVPTFDAALVDLDNRRAGRSR